MSRRILLLEDEEDIRIQLKEYLEYKGYEVQDSGDGKEGLELILKNLPDLAIVDVKLPSLNGLEILAAVKREHPQLPMIILTGYHDSQLEKEVSLYAQSFLYRKPIGLVELDEALSKALGS